MQNIKSKTLLFFILAGICLLTYSLYLTPRAYADTNYVYNSDDSSMKVLEVTGTIQAQVHSSNIGDNVISYTESNPQSRYSLKNIAQYESTNIPVTLYKTQISNVSGLSSTPPNITVTINDTIIAQYTNGQYIEGSSYSIQPGETVYPTVHIDNWDSLSTADRAKLATNKDIFSIKYFANALSNPVERIYGKDAPDTNYEAFKQYRDLYETGEVDSKLEILIVQAAHQTRGTGTPGSQNAYSAINLSSWSNYMGKGAFICCEAGMERILTDTSSVNDFSHVFIVGGTKEDQDRVYTQINNLKSSNSYLSEIKIYSNLDNAPDNTDSIRAMERNIAVWNKLGAGAFSDVFPDKTTIKSKTAFVVYGNDYDGYTTKNSSGEDLSCKQGNEEDLEAIAMSISSYCIKNNSTIFVVDPNKGNLDSIFSEISGFSKVVFLGDGKNANSGSNSMIVLANQFKKKYPNVPVDTIRGNKTLTSNGGDGDDKFSLSIAFAQWAINQAGNNKADLNYVSVANNNALSWSDCISATTFMSKKNCITLGCFDRGPDSSNYSFENTTVYINITSTKDYSYSGSTTCKSFLENYQGKITKGFAYGGSAAVAETGGSSLESFKKIILSKNLNYIITTPQIKANSASYTTKTANITWGNNAFINTYGWNNYKLPDVITCKDTSGNTINCNVKWDFSSISPLSIWTSNQVLGTSGVAFKYGYDPYTWTVTGTLYAPTSNTSFGTGTTKTVSANIYAPAAKTL